MKNQLELNQTYVESGQQYVVEAIKVNQKTEEKFVLLRLLSDKNQTVVRPYELLLNNLQGE